MFKRTISLLLLTSMLAALASCGSSESDGKTGDIVDDAVYNRNSAVEELLGNNFRQAV